MKESQVFGLILAIFGLWIVASSRGAYAWYSNAWRMSDSGADSWFAMLMGRRLVNAIHLVVGFVCLVSGALFAVGIL
jgi:hypothetical protein